jgi:hypothetical protein
MEPPLPRTQKLTMRKERGVRGDEKEKPNTFRVQVKYLVHMQVEMR